MADYKKMYAVLCGAVDDIIDTLEEIPLAFSSAKILRNALEQAEEIYIETTPYIEVTDEEILIKIDTARGNPLENGSQSEDEKILGQSFFLWD